jgi:hypothetical protein
MDQFKLIIAGSRAWDRRNPGHVCFIEGKVFELLAVKMRTHQIEIVSGCAVGADKIGESMAAKFGWPVTQFPYLSDLGRRGGPMRNAQMASYADAAAVFIIGGSAGSEDMVSQMRARGKPVRVFRR